MKKGFFIFILLFFPVSLFAADMASLPPVRTHWCYTLPLLKQRVECRLGLSEKDLAEERAKLNLPEECRVLRKGKLQDSCIARYETLQSCVEKPIGDERNSCAREALAVSDDLASERITCSELNKQKATRKQSAACFVSLRQKVYDLVKFRLYDLNGRVEKFLQENETIDGRPGVQFIVASELNIQRFSNARTKQQRLQIIRNERSLWQRFANVAKLDDLNDFLDDAIDELTAVE